VTTLEAVNEMLEAIQQPPVTALDTGGNSDEGEAESILDRESRRIQQRGWYANTEDNTAFGVPDTKIAVSGGAGTFSFGETVTQSGSGATGTFDHILSGFMYLHSTSGTFVSGPNTLTGGVSGATRTAGAYTAITSSRIAYNVDEILRAYPSTAYGETQRVVMRGGFFFDTKDNTLVFDSDEDLTLKIVRLLDLDELTPALADYIVKQAAVAFVKYKMPGRRDAIAIRMDDAATAKIHALQEDHDLRRTNVHETLRSREFLGDRQAGVIPIP
jgi:hypothetical protein